MNVALYRRSTSFSQAVLVNIKIGFDLTGGHWLLLSVSKSELLNTLGQSSKSSKILATCKGTYGAFLRTKFRT